MNRATDDLISKAAAIEAAFKGADDWDGGFNPKYLNELPTVDAAPVVHGQWIDYKDDHQCSVCKEHTIYDTYAWKAVQFEFCPWCGAKMEAKND